MYWSFGVLKAEKDIRDVSQKLANICVEFGGVFGIGQLFHHIIIYSVWKCGFRLWKSLKCRTIKELNQKDRSAYHYELIIIFKS